MCPREMNQNAKKTVEKIVSRSCRMHHKSPPFLGGSVLKESVDLDILVVTFDARMSIEKHLLTVYTAASLRLV